MSYKNKMIELQMPLSKCHSGQALHLTCVKKVLNEAAIAEKRPSAANLNNIIHPHPERDFFVLYHEDES